MKHVMLGIFSCIAVVILITVFKLFSTVERGTYQIKQAIITGEMSAHMEPGWYFRALGDTQTWPKAETFYFTADEDEGEAKNQSIEVRFVDGSTAEISGTMRIQLPTNPQQAIDLVTKQGYRSMEDLEYNLILKVVRNALTLTANMMTARESYAENRNDYVFWSWDQIQNGIYETEEAQKDVVDPATGEKITKIFKIIKRDKNGVPVYQRSALGGTGITVSNFEIKKIVYSKTVDEQIQTQQRAYMSVATSKAEAQKAEQEKLKIEAEGKTAVAKSQYEQEVDKVKQVVEAQKRLEVAKLDKESAALKKAKDILEGEGEAEKRKLIMSADGALDAKLAAWTEVNTVYAEAIKAQKWVPEVQVGGSSGGNAAQELINLFMAKTAKDIGLELSNTKQQEKK